MLNKMIAETILIVIRLADWMAKVAILAVAARFVLTGVIPFSGTQPQLPTFSSKGATQVSQNLTGSYPGMQSGYADLFIKYGEQYDIHPYLLEAQAFRESAYNPDARGGSGEIGISQFMPSTWADFGCEGEMSNPDDSIKCQAQFMAYLMGQWEGNPDKVALTLSSYNAGLSGTRNAGGIPSNGYTPAYVRDILAGYEMRSAADTLQSKQTNFKTSSNSSLPSIYPEGTVWGNSGTLAWHESARDIAAGCGTPIISPISGRITMYNQTDYFVGKFTASDGIKVERDYDGNTLIEVTNSEYRVKILHAEWVEGMNVGDQVKQGDLIGYEDSIGNTTNCHAHVEIQQGDSFIDPYNK